MKKRILQILDVFKKHPTLKKAGISLHVNLEKVIPEYRKIEAKYVSETVISEKIDELGDIESFNITASIDTGIDNSKDDPRERYKFNWASVDFIFYSATDSIKDVDKYCRFNYKYLGDAGEIRMLSGDSISLVVPDDNSESYSTIKQNVVEYQHLPELLGILVQYTNMIARQHVERAELVDVLRKIEEEEV